MTSQTGKKSWKILFAGSVGSGKTTAVKTLSDTEVVSTEAKASDSVKLMKENTTVAMDYGTMKLKTGEYVRLYGSPGQKRFDFMWEVLAEGALGVIILVDASAEKPMDDLKFYVGEFRDLIERTAFAVGVTKLDVEDVNTSREDIAKTLIELGLPPTVLSVDARKRRDMAILVKTMLFSADPFCLTPNFRKDKK